MPAAIPAVIGAGASIIGGRQQRNAQRDAINASRTELGPFFGVGPGQVNANFDASTGGVNVDLGDLNPIRTGLRDFALGNLTSAIPSLGGAEAASNSLAGLLGQRVPGGDFSLNRAEGRALNASRLAEQGLNQAQGPFQGDLQSQLFSGAQGSLADIGRAGQVEADTLANLRAQAQPQQERAVSSQLNNLFASGRLGTTGGANVIGRLAEAQNQQDLGFQQAARAEGRAAPIERLLPKKELVKFWEAIEIPREVAAAVARTCPTVPFVIHPFKCKISSS